MKWETKRVGDVCQILNGGTPKTGVKDYWDGDIAWITPKDMGKLEDVYVSRTERRITQAGVQNSSAKLLPPGSIILSTRAPIGHLAINEVPMTTNQGCKGLVLNDKVNNKYLYYYLKSNVELLDSLGSGTTFKELAGSKLADVPLPLPPLPEQQRIVTKLDAAFGALSEAQANLERNRANARELFESYLNGVFEGKGDGWMEYTLPDLADNLDSRRVPITKSDRKAGPYPYYGASGIVDYVHDFIFDQECLLISEDGANLLMRSTPIAFSVSGKYWVNNHAHILRFRDRATQKLVEHYLEKIDLSPWITGAAQPKLNQSAMNSIPIWLPVDLNAREDLVQRLDAIQQETKQLESTYQQKLLELEGLKKGLLGAAFRGEL